VITGIVVALVEELSTLTTKRLKKGDIDFLTDNLWLIYSGAGPENARVAAETLIKRGVSQLISWGCAAALDASLQAGDLVLAVSFVDAGQERYGLDNKDWVNKVETHFAKQFSIQTGSLAESQCIIESSLDKAKLAILTGAIALDMESAAIAKVAKLHSLDFLAVRAIADPVTMDLPKAVSYAIDENGEVVLSKLLFFLLLHPSDLLGLMRLGIYFYAAKNTLKRVAKEIDVVVNIKSLAISSA
jgi:adenosylhomocysteine nucleosidase